MKKKILLFSMSVLAAAGIQAQTWVNDSVTMGAGYANDIYYSLANGAVQSSNNQTWALAFQMTPQGPYGNVSIFANHAQKNVSVYSLHLKASTNFATLTALDTIGKTGDAHKLYNSDTSWNVGAFNRMPNGDPFNYGWGQYDQMSHNVVGDSLYLVTVGSTAYKVWIKKYVSYPADSVQWQFRIAEMTGAMDNEVRLYRKPGYADDLFAYYNPADNTVADRDPGRSTWDFMFTRYVEYVPGAPGNNPYPVMGVASNFGTLVAAVKNVDDDTAQYQHRTFSKDFHSIGSDWKVFMNPTGPWVVDTGATYFVKSVSSNQYWQLSFTGFSGASTPIYFRKRSIQPTSVKAVQSAVSGYSLFPNPATNLASLMIEAKEAGKAAITVSNLSGQVMLQRELIMQQGLNGFSISTADYPAGTYLVSLSNGTWKTTEKLVVVH